jgi:hypothetical protein
MFNIKTLDYLIRLSQFLALGASGTNKKHPHHDDG